MTVKIRPYRKRGAEGWEVDVQVRLPDGTRVRERTKSPVDSKSGALRWGKDREAHLLVHGPEKPVKAEVPTLETFWPRFMEGYARANNEKPNTIATRERIWTKHIQPAFGRDRLDSITTEAVQVWKGKLSKLSPKSINCILTNLRRCLAVAVEWDVIPSVPCRIRQLKAAKPIVAFYEEPEYERLVQAAALCDPRTHVAVLLAGEAGLRLGEVLGLEWPDVDTQRGLLKVQRAVSDDGTATLPKSGKPRVVPTTTRLRDALAKHRHLRGERVLTDEEGKGLDKWTLKWLVDVAERRAGLRQGGRVHILRHTFCSRLAARNVPLMAIKELAGHRAVETTMRYMHLSAAAPREAIRSLEARGDILETRPGEIESGRKDA